MIFTLLTIAPIQKFCIIYHHIPKTCITSRFHISLSCELDGMYTSIVFFHLMGECGRSPPFEEYIGNLLAVFVWLRVFAIRFILYKCPIENGDGLSYIPKIFNRVPHLIYLIARIFTGSGSAGMCYLRRGGILIVRTLKSACSFIRLWSALRMFFTVIILAHFVSRKIQ